MQPPPLPRGQVLEPLMVSEIADRWGWAYGKAYARLDRAFQRGRLSKIQRPGHQPYYFADQVEELFGTPGNIGPAPAYAQQYPEWSLFDDADDEMAS